MPEYRASLSTKMMLERHERFPDDINFLKSFSSEPTFDQLANQAYQQHDNLNLITNPNAPRKFFKKCI